MYSFNNQRDGYWGNGIFETKEEAIAEAKQCYGENYDIFIGECAILDIPMLDTMTLLELIDENYANNVVDSPEYDEFLFPSVRELHNWSQERREKYYKALNKFENTLQVAFENFLEDTNIKPSWFNVVNIEQIQYRKE